MTDGSESLQATSKRIREGGFAVALSGGGHRATLMTLGALMALVDRGLGGKIIQIASVSGGSITNAFVAQRCRIDELGPGGLDPVAAELAGLIIHKAVLTRAWIGLLLLGPVIVGIGVGFLSYWFLLPSRAAALLIGAVVALGLLLARGQAVEWLLDQRYFRHGPNARGFRRARLSCLAGRGTEHVFCMTDLALGLPIYASSAHGGFVWRRLEPEYHGLLGTHPKFQTFPATKITLAELVRASAAFPGIPPRRWSLPPDDLNPLVAKQPSVAFLADGGIWNNLGSQVLREDGFVGSHAAWDNGNLRPYVGSPKDMPLLCVNGSAPLRPAKRPWLFNLPVFALAKSMWQIVEILNVNTVLPRVTGILRTYQRRVWKAERPDHLDPLDLVVDLRPPDEIVEHYRNGLWSPKLIRKSDPTVKDWERQALTRLGVARGHAAQSSETDWLGYLLGAEPEPEGSYPVVGLANIDDWDALRESALWKALVERENGEPLHVPTTLGRIEAGQARKLITRGYLNTYFVSLFLAPLAEGELDRLADLVERLDKVVFT
jgi:hypothetical protein